MDSLNSKPVVDAIEIERIMTMIPHRYPFLLVDRVIDVVIIVQISSADRVL